MVHADNEMKIQYVCPACRGAGAITTREPPSQNMACGPQPKTCHRCHGEGFVWEPLGIVGGSGLCGRCFGIPCVYCDKHEEAKERKETGDGC